MNSTPPATDSARYRDMRHVTVVGAVVNVVLTLLKLVVGWLGHSQALIADGMHSLSDLVSDVVVLVAAKQGSRHADEDHPYGHARFETVATLVVGALLVLVALEIALNAGRRLFNHDDLLRPTSAVLVVTVLSIISKELLYHYTMAVAKRLRSHLLRANAWHHRSDSISSVVVLLGVIGSMLGVVWLDAVAAIAVSLMIAHIGWDLGKKGVTELVDTALEPEKLQQIRTVIQSVCGVQALHELRTRRMGESALVDVHILVDSDLSVSEGHQVSETVRNRLIQQIDEISDVMVHIDPEDDQAQSLNSRLPLRDQASALLQQSWQGLAEAEQIQHLTLHYLRGQISADVYLPLRLSPDPASGQRLAAEFSRRAEALAVVRRVRVFYVGDTDSS